MNTVIVTCKNYEKALSNVLETIQHFGKIIIVNANSSEDSYKVINENVIHVNIVKNFYEYTGWLGIDLLVRNNIVDINEWFFMTHDTTMFTEKSQIKMIFILKVISHTPIEFYSLVGGRFHNICLCRKSGVQKIANHFHNIETMTKKQACDIETTLPTLLDSNIIGEYSFQPINYLGKEIMPGKKTTIFESIDMYKFYI